MATNKTEPAPTLTEAQAARIEHLELAIEAALEKYGPDLFHAEAGRILRDALKNE